MSESVAVRPTQETGGAAAGGLAGVPPLIASAIVIITLSEKMPAEAITALSSSAG